MYFKKKTLKTIKKKKNKETLNSLVFWSQHLLTRESRLIVYMLENYPLYFLIVKSMTRTMPNSQLWYWRCVEGGSLTSCFILPHYILHGAGLSALYARASNSSWPMKVYEIHHSEKCCFSGLTCPYVFLLPWNYRMKQQCAEAARN